MTRVHSSLCWLCSIAQSQGELSSQRKGWGGTEPPVLVLIPSPVKGIPSCQPILELFLSAFLLPSSFS